MLPTVVANYVDVCLKTRPKIQSIRANLQPVVWALIDVKASTYFYRPTVTQSDFTVMEIVVLFDLHRNIKLFQTVGDRQKLWHCVLFLMFLVESCNQDDFLRLADAHRGFAEAQEIHDLVLVPDV